jgi:hypothetical protein
VIGILVHLSNDIIILNTPLDDFIKILSSSYELSLGSSHNAGVAPEKSSSVSIGNFWPKINKTEGATVAFPQSLRSFDITPLIGSGEIQGEGDDQELKISTQRYHIRAGSRTLIRCRKWSWCEERLRRQL